MTSWKSVVQWPPYTEPFGLIDDMPADRLPLNRDELGAFIVRTSHVPNRPTARLFSSAGIASS